MIYVAKIQIKIIKNIKFNKSRQLFSHSCKLSNKIMNHKRDKKFTNDLTFLTEMRFKKLPKNFQPCFSGTKE